MEKHYFFNGFEKLDLPKPDFETLGELVELVLEMNKNKAKLSMMNRNYLLGRVDTLLQKLSFYEENENIIDEWIEQWEESGYCFDRMVAVDLKKLK